MFYFRLGYIFALRSNGFMSFAALQFLVFPVHLSDLSQVLPYPGRQKEINLGELGQGTKVDQSHNPNSMNLGQKI